MCQARIAVQGLMETTPLILQMRNVRLTGARQQPQGHQLTHSYSKSFDSQGPGPYVDQALECPVNTPVLRGLLRRLDVEVLWEGEGAS